MRSPRTALRISEQEHRELRELADKAGIPLAVAFRRGARAYLLAHTLEDTMGKPGRPRKGAVK